MCLYTFIYIYLSIYLFIYLSIDICIYTYTNLPVNAIVSLSLHLGAEIARARKGF